jgi:alkylation response protein AidB-like acyl-CoA dehydrogenase
MHRNDDIVPTSKRLSPQIRAARQQADDLRQTPSVIADAITEAGLYQMYLPRSVGGSEMSPVSAFLAIEELSKADGSVGWNAMIATVLSYFTAWLAPEIVRSMCGEPANLRMAGSLRPQGGAWPVDGGYRVKGQWNFASGIRNANWLHCTCMVMDGDNPEITAAGTPRVRVMWVPAAAATIMDTWSVIGMRGTGSQDFTVGTLDGGFFVPAERTHFAGDPPVEKGPLYQPRGVFMNLFATVVANSLGIARAAIDDFVLLASHEGSTQSPTLLRERAFVQTSVAQAEAILNAARTYMIDALGRSWEAQCAEAADITQEIVQTRLATTHAMHETVRVVDMLFRAAGTNAIYTSNPLERHFRDIHVAVQHNAGFPVHFESAGKVLMGLRPTDPGW